VSPPGIRDQVDGTDRTTQRPIVGRYRLDQLIGQGSMGSVYRAIDAETGGAVAVKRLRRDTVLRDPRTVSRFLREGQTLRRLDHPNIVKLLDSFEDEGDHYLVMELVGGGSLEQQLRSRSEPFELARLLDLALGVSNALGLAHQLNVVHRDLKPSNVLIAEDGTPRLSDFGVAFVVGAERLSTRDGILGTLDYVSPESLRGEDVDGRADVWSLGVLLFQLLTGRRPFASAHAAATLQAVLGSPPPDLEALRPDCPIALVDLVYRMLEKDRAQRIPNARRVASELQDIIANRAAARPKDGVAGGNPAREPGRKPSSGDSSEAERPPAAGFGPSAVTPFIGREHELADLAALFRDPAVRLVTIVGPGGMGKSRLAIEAGRLIATGSGAFEETLTGTAAPCPAAFLVELAPLGSPDLLATAIAGAVGLTFFAGSDPRAQLLAHLRDRSVVLVLDNFEHLLAASPLIDEILTASRGTRILATSRERLNLRAERVFTLAGLGVPDASALDRASDFSGVELFVASARRVKADFSLAGDAARTVGCICSLVEGMPLAIVLGASWVNALTLEEIAREIAGGGGLLADERGDAPARQHSIRSVFDHSWKLLSLDERALFARLGVFRGGFTRGAAQAVAGATLRTLAALVNKSLVARDPDSGRYRMHELCRQYAERRLADVAGDHQRTALLHGEHFAGFLRAREDGLKSAHPETAAKEIEAELDNVRVAWSRLLEMDRLGDVSAAMEALQIFYTLRSSFDEGETTFGSAGRILGKAAPARGTERARLAGLALAHQAAFLDGQWRRREANEVAARALELLDERAHPREAASALLVRGSTLIRMGEQRRGFEMAERALAIHRTADNPWDTARALTTLGLLSRDAVGPARAEAYYRESIGVQESFGDRVVVVPYSLAGLGYLMTERGQYEEGLRLMLDGLALCERRGDASTQELCLQQIGWVHYKLGEYSKAEAYQWRAFSLAGQIFSNVENWNHICLGGILLEQDRLDEAAAHYRTSLQSENERTTATATRGMGDVAFARGDLTEARRLYLECLASYEHAGTVWGVAETYDRLGYLACREGQLAHARACFRRALANEADSAPFVLSVVAGIAHYCALAGAGERALQLLALVRSHPATEHRTRVRRVDPLLATLSREVHVHEARDPAERLDLPALVRKLACDDDPALS